ncbi:MAG: class I SAM-dependent methyltransferase [Deltaproteobacteria bacterium]|nr:class I SAM-dependent methyltransferase [Deltaproteobacteria bacterium]
MTDSAPGPANSNAGRDDAALLEHYVRRGRGARDGGLEAAWLDYELRSYVLARLPARRPLAVCNVGIGDGQLDDWLALVVGAPIVSVDPDPGACRLLELRQRREEHPHPSRVVCGDVRGGALAGRRFDVITCVRPLADGDDGGHLQRALRTALADGGVLLTAEIGQGAAADRVLSRGDVWLACSTRTR